MHQRESGDADEVLAATLRKAVRKVDPEFPVSDVRSMEARIADSLIARRSPALLAGLFFSCIALLLTALGTYEVLSYAVAHNCSSRPHRRQRPDCPDSALVPVRGIPSGVNAISLVSTPGFLTHVFPPVSPSNSGRTL